ncbi:similar to Saccharomyces cerevisiae YJL081C ARP4 Nuclear actin-related protein involved in chromatin remodeling, component of chromatin-remodeling enzyme complexes [Maudiozyma saulgeensis]|uniref:Actin-related protein 4 n=1 Tax=Maudiozyma saulgeensis TaxID=1789683 RepID=A0A1X7R801_9SACH|nr:similar to Saccharomyces cerevisiae YJL081C ARP4 Nuclear actin-related protein involved in chromatin remodeling, component of chromatin-remodeling enzyme complexes [Kazachstania saulgeensis]
MSNPALQVYGGDEISAVVIDPGSYRTNIGLAGTDCPNVSIPSQYGCYKEDTSAGDKSEENDKEDKADIDNNMNKKKHVFPEQSIAFPRKDYEIKPIVENGVVTDWDVAQEQWSWALEKEMYLESNKGMPVLLTEPIWNPVENRKKSLEVLLEGLEFEACYLASTASCVSFAAGRPNCLVIDIGHDTCSVSPVVDGMTLSKSTMRSPFAGKYMNHLLDKYLAPREIIPLFAVAQKRPEFKKKEFSFSVDPSLYKFANNHEIFQEMKETLCQISPDGPLENMKDQLESQAKRSIETQWGETIVFDNTTRYGFGEQLFNVKSDDVPSDWEISKDGTVETWHNDYVPLKRNKPSGGNKDASVAPSESSVNPDETPNENGKRPLGVKKNDIAGIADLAYLSIMASDVDLRASLAHNIVLTGGSSQIPGLGDRLIHELGGRLQALKFRIMSSGHTSERQYQSWLGGSILSSLGTFHQLWVGKEEYAEVGADRLLTDRFR